MGGHLKRLAAPRSWPLTRKTNVWTTKTEAGPHGLEDGIPLLHVIRDQLGKCDTAREARRIIGNRQVLIDGKTAARYKRPVGLMDVISIPATKENYRMLLDRHHRLKPVKISSDQSTWKLARLEGTHTIKGGAFQLHTHDGRNIIQAKMQYRSGTSLKISLPDQKILHAYPLAADHLALITGGSHAGQIATIKTEKITRNPKPNIVSFKEDFSTTRNHVFVIGKDTPEIILPESV